MDLFDDLLADDLTPELKAVARDRILAGGNLATKRGINRIEKAIVVHLVNRLSPETVLTVGEIAILRCVSRNTASRLRPE